MKREKSKQRRTCKKMTNVKTTVPHEPMNLKEFFPSKALSKKLLDTLKDKLKVPSNESIDHQLPNTLSPYEAIAQYPYDQTYYRMEVNRKVHNYISLYPSMNAELITATGLQKMQANMGFFDMQMMEAKKNFFQNYYGNGFN